MKKKLLKEIIKKKQNKIEFSIVTNLKSGESCIFDKNKKLEGEFGLYKDKISLHYKNKKNGIIENTDIFIDNYVLPIKVIIVGAVHIAQHIVNFTNNLNFEISIIDPRGYFASKQRFSNVNVVNKWPEEAFKKLVTDKNTALIALTHDPKIDDPALQYALKNNFFYIGALGSKKTHENRCSRLRQSGFSSDEVNKIFGPIGIKLGGRSAPEIALSIVAQLVSEIYKK